MDELTEQFLNLFKGQTLDDDMDLSLAKAAASLCRKKMKEAWEKGQYWKGSPLTTFEVYLDTLNKKP